jgi:hypothetical protein
LGEWNSSIGIKSKSIGDTSPAVSANAPTAFAMVRPVLADFGLTALADQRYLTLGVDDDNAGLHLWGSYVKADGAKGSLASWTTETPAKEVFANATAVCGIDATVNASGTLGILTVLRKAGQDLVVLITRDAKGVVKAEQLVGQESQGDCRVGVAAARLAWTGKAWLPMVFETALATTPFQGSVKYLWSNSALKVPLPQGIVAATLDNAASGGPTHALAWRAVVRPVHDATSMTTAVEAVNGTDARSIHLWSWAP